MKLKKLLKYYKLSNRPKSDLAKDCGAHLSAVCNRDDSKDIPDGWLWRLRKNRPDIIESEGL